MTCARAHLGSELERVVDGKLLAHVVEIIRGDASETVGDRHTYLRSQVSSVTNDRTDRLVIFTPWQVNRSFNGLSRVIHFVRLRL
jgi:hypothetical protein